MTKEKMLEIIEQHNKAATFFETLGDVKVPADVIFRLMPLASHHGRLGLTLTQEARRMGIDAKCFMQSGEITVHGDLEVTGE